MPFTAAASSTTKNSSRSYSFSDLDIGNDAQVVSFVKGRWEDRSNRRQTLERQWYVNVAYYLGFQYLEWSNAQSELVLPAAPPWRVRLVANRLQIIVRKLVSKFLRQKPTWNVLSATADQEDVLKALAATQVLKYYWRLRGMDAKLVDLFTWMGCTGNAFMRTYWNPLLGTELDIRPEETNPDGLLEQGRSFLKGLFGRDMDEGVKTRTGDLDFEVFSPFEIDPDPAARNMDEITHLIQTTARSPKQIEDSYGRRVPSDGSTDNLTRYYLERIASFSGPHSAEGYGDYNTDHHEDTTVEHTLWVEPSKDWPRGHFAVVAGGEVLKRGELDTPRIPFIHVQEIPVPGRFWGTCALEQAMHLQIEYNRCRSQTIENRNQMARPKWLVPKGSGIIDTGITSEPGEVVDYNFPHKPEMVPPPPLPEYVFKTHEYVLRDLDDISAQHEVSNAKVPSGVRSGVAIAQLQEQDDSMLGPSMMMAEAALSKLGSDALRLIHKYVTEKRLVKIMGDSGQIETMSFIGPDLVGERREEGINYFDVEVQMGSQLPQSKAARAEFIKELVQYGILDPQAHRQTVLEMLQIGTEVPLFEESKLDQNEIYRENLQLDQGMMLEINPWDDDEAHMMLHRQRQKRPDYKRITSENPQIYQLYEQHIRQHVERLKQTQAVQAEAAQGQQPQEQQPQQPSDISDQFFSGMTDLDLAGMTQERMA